MPLTEKQQQFLDKYVSKWGKRISKSKRERAESFQRAREDFFKELEGLPKELHSQFLEEIKGADGLGEKLKFNRATDAINIVTAEVRLAKLQIELSKSMSDNAFKVLDHDLLSDDEFQKIKLQYEDAIADHGTGYTWDDMIKNTEHGQMFQDTRKHIDLLMKNGALPINSHKQIQSLIWRIANKRKLLERRPKEIEKLKHRLERDAKSLLEGTDEKDTQLDRALVLSSTPTNEWTESMLKEGMSLYMDLTLKIATRDGIKGKDFKLNEINKDDPDREIVFAIRRKYQTVEGPIEKDSDQDRLIDSNNPNFKLVLKPLTREVNAGVFAKGSQGGRESIASLMSNKLQELAGLDFGLPETHLTKVDGGLIGMTPGTEEFVSAQYFNSDGETPSKIAIKEGIQIDPFIGFYKMLDERVSKKELQKVALFDLISLNTDRHADNMMITSQGNLVPIDHGAILPTFDGFVTRKGNFNSNAPIPKCSSSQENFDDSMLEAIDRLDPENLKTSLELGLQNLPNEESKAGIMEGIQLSTRSIEFLKFAARHLTIAEIYTAYSAMPKLIFQSTEEEKLSSFAKAVKSIAGAKHNDAQIRKFAGISPEVFASAHNHKLTVQKLADMGWVKYSLFGNAPTRELLLLSIREIFESNIPPPSFNNIDEPPPKDSINPNLWNWFLTLGGNDACVRNGIKKLTSNHKRLKNADVETAVGELQYVLLLKQSLP